MTSLPITPIVRGIHAELAPPGSKSITNRALVLAALATGSTTLTGALDSRDTRIMVAALRELGFGVETRDGGSRITIHGGGGVIPRDHATLHFGNSGTTARFLTALLALHPNGEYFLDGDPPLRARPMSGLLNALADQGTVATAPDGSPATHFPFTLRTCGLKGGEIAVDAFESSQILSALLMVAALAKNDTRIELKGETVSKPFLEMTVRMMAQFGHAVETAGTAYRILQKGAHPAPDTYAIEPDATAASYFLALPLAAPATVCVHGLREDGLQGDVAFVDVLKKLGVDVRNTTDGIRVTAQPAAHHAPASATQLDFDFNDISDTFLTLAALAPLLPFAIKIRNVAHARKQETDRVLAAATELERLGQRVEPAAAVLRANPQIGDFTVFPDLDAMRRRTASVPVSIQTYEDHRIAMSFAILGCHDLHGDGRPWLVIEDPECCGKTYPKFFEVLASVGRNYELRITNYELGRQA